MKTVKQYLKENKDVTLNKLAWSMWWRMFVGYMIVYIAMLGLVVLFA